MTDIEAKALALVNEVRAERGWVSVPTLYRTDVNMEALCRAIEQHEAFRQEVSDAVEKQAQTGWDIHCRCGTRHPISFNTLEQFIIPKPKPDPLVDVMKEAGWADAVIDSCAPSLRAALDALGFEIREKNDD
jgi:hypothetical protein